MKPLIKNAIVYKAELPTADLLRKHIEDHQFTELLSLELQSSGFVPIEATGDLVTEFQGGLAFAIRHDQKIIPASAVNAELNKRVERITDEQGFAPGRKLRAEIKEMVFDSMLPNAFSKTAVITAFYDIENQYLIVPVSSKALADIVIGKLIHAVGSVKTQTIHVSDIKHGLTTRLKTLLEDDDDQAFGPFEACDEVSLERRMDSGRERVSVKMNILESARAGLSEAIDSMFTVSAIRFRYGAVTFRLTSDFHFKSISYDYEPDPDANQEDRWQHEASVQMLEISRVISALCDLLGYKAPDLTEEPKAA